MSARSASGWRRVVLRLTRTDQEYGGWRSEGSKAMNTCVICRFQVELDDAVTPTAGSYCVCLRCFARETDTVRAMPKDFPCEIMAVLTAAGTAEST